MDSRAVNIQQTLTSFSSHDPFGQPTTNNLQQSQVSIAMSTKEAAALAELAANIRKQRLLQCTHMNMVRTPGDRPCQQCGKIPAIGFLYQCRQDFDERAPKWPLDPGMDFVNVSRNFFIESTPDAVTQAQNLRMSPSTIKQIRAGVYSSKELEKLFNQRAHVIRMLRAALSGQPAQPIHEEAPVVHTKSWYLDARNSERDGLIVEDELCIAEICHSCKPWLESRLYEHPDTVFEHGRQQPALKFTIREPPARDASVLSRITLPGEPQRVSSQPSNPIVHSITPGTLSSPISMSSSVYSSDSSASDLFPLTKALAELSQGDEDFEAAGNLEEGQNSFLDTPSLPQSTPLRRRLFLQSTPSDLSESPGSASETSSISPLTPLHSFHESFEASFEKKLGTFGKSASFCGPFRHIESGAGSHGDKQDMGLSMVEQSALTEESVEVGQPDIIIASV